MTKDYAVDYLSVANRDILAYEAGSYVQRYVYATDVYLHNSNQNRKWKEYEMLQKTS